MEATMVRKHGRTQSARGRQMLVGIAAAIALAAGAAAERREARADDDDTEESPVAQTGQLAVVVKDENGKPVATKGRVGLGDLGKATTHRWISLVVAVPGFEIEEGTYWVEVQADCYETQRMSKVKVLGGAQRGISFTMKYICDDLPTS